MKEHKTTQKSPLGLVAGLGTGKYGTRDWWHQRITSVALIFLGLWTVYVFTWRVPTEYHQALMWLRFPLHALLLIITILVGLYHGALGLQVIIEDYVHTPWCKLILIYAVKFLAVLLAVGSIISLVKIMYLSI
jgi:succinate dehydrogenase / fumarate reductase membrane anchor subunit